jgi:hypothetical protein
MYYGFCRGALHSSMPERSAGQSEMGAPVAQASVEQEIFTRKEASEYLRKKWKQRVSVQTLNGYATAGKGPPYRTTNTMSGAFYTKTDLDTWAAGRLIPGKVAAA